MLGAAAFGQTAAADRCKWQGVGRLGERLLLSIVTPFVKQRPLLFKLNRKMHPDLRHVCEFGARFG
jgi:hypothetical protein